MRAFYAPVGLTPYEVADVARALQDNPCQFSGCEPLYWVPCPPGLAPDVWLTHLRCVELDDEEEEPGSSMTGATTSNRHIQRIQLDDEGRYKGRPVCLLGDDEDTYHEWRNNSPDAGRELAALLCESCGGLPEAGSQFELTRRMVLLRAAWRDHRIVWQDAGSGQMLAMASVRVRKVWWRADTCAATMARAKTRTARYDKPLTFEPQAFTVLSFWQLLWDYVQRCCLSDMQVMLPTHYWPLLVQIHRPAHMPQQALSDAARHILVQLAQAGSLAVEQLLAQGRFDPEDLQRALTGLLFTRVISLERPASGAATEGVLPGQTRTPAVRIRIRSQADAAPPAIDMQEAPTQIP